MIHFILGGSGCGKSTLLQKKIQSHPSKENIITLVPEQFSYAFDKKLYQALGPISFNQLETHSFKSLARSIFQKHGTNTGSIEYASDTIQLAVLLQTLFQEAEEHKTIQFFQSVWNKPDFFQELHTLIQLFRRNGKSSSDLYEQTIHFTGRMSEKTMDLVRIYQQYEYLMEQYHLRDTMTNLTEAAAIANMQEVFLGKTIFIDEFESFTEDEYEMLQVLFSDATDLYIALRTENASETSLSFFEPVHQTYRRLLRLTNDLHLETKSIYCEHAVRFAFSDLSFLSTNIFRNQNVQFEKGEHIHVFEAKDPYEEVEYVCATIRHLLMDYPTLRCHDIAIVTNMLSDYQFILEHQMKKYQLPYHIDLGKPILHIPIMVYIITLLTFLDQKHIDTESIFRYGKTYLTDCTALELAELENYCYLWDISGTALEQPFSENTDENHEMEQIRQKLMTPILTLKKDFSRQHTYTEFCTLLFQFLEHQSIPNRMELQIKEIESSKQLQAKEDFSFAWTNFVDLLDVLSKVDSGKSVSTRQFCTIFIALLKTSQMRVPPRTLDSIFIGQAKTSRLDDPKITFVLGATEGNFPSCGKGALIYTQQELKQLEQLHILTGNSMEYLMAEELLAVYKTISSASEALYLTYPLSDVSQQESYPATTIASILSLFQNGSDLQKSSKSIDSSYYAVTFPATYSRFIQEYAKQDESIVTMQAMLCEQPYYREKLNHLFHLNKGTNFSIQTPSIMKELVGDTITISATKLEQYEICPFQYFCSNALQLFYRQRNTLNAVQSGNLIHYCLEQFLSCYSKNTFLSLQAEQIQANIQVFSKQYFDQHLLNAYGTSNRMEMEYQKLLNNISTVIHHLQEELQQTSFYPVYLELPIHPKNIQFPPMLLQTNQGDSIRIIGKVDRVDTYIDPSDHQLWVRVIDYKSGKHTFSFSNLLYGLDMQMLIYLATLLQPGTPLEHAKPAGILYDPVGILKKDLKREEKISIDQHINDSYRMSGILLDNVPLIRKMETGNSGTYLPIIEQNEGLKGKENGILLNEMEFQQLFQYMKQKVIDMAESVFHGKIEAAPLQLNSSMQPCQHCPYHTICGTLKYENVRTSSLSKKEANAYMHQLLQEEKTGKEETET